MKHLTLMLRWEWLHLWRNQLITVSIVLGAVYVGFFFLLKNTVNLNALVLFMVYNDPVVTAFLFAGVLLMFEKNQATLQPLGVLPVHPRAYILSKVIALSLLALAMALIMSLAMQGTQIHYAHYITGVLLGATQFALLGIWVAAASRSLNAFIAKSAGVLLPMLAPFAGVYGLVPAPLLYFIPGYASLIVLQASVETVPALLLVGAYAYALLSIGLFYLLALKGFKKAAH